ncbi:hypothetical protein HG530_005578 [Fusarium avenaceum]|nr:hypothetical protein HG530_005578 [Fusarium avenaceum]
MPRSREPSLEETISSEPSREPERHGPNFTADLVCPINSDDIKNRWLNSYVPLPGQTVKAYSPNVMNFVYRMLKSYTSMVIRGRTPPFIHPAQLSTPLSTCFTLVRICKDPLPGSESVAADILQREMTNLYDQRGTYDGVELLGAFQAYLIYSMVLFFHLSPVSMFLRQAIINLQDIACLTSQQGLVCVAEQQGIRPQWEAWIVAEAKRRTLYTMYFLDNVLSTQDGLPTYLGHELKGLYAPSSKILWQADQTEWERAYNSHLAEWTEGTFQLDQLWPIPSDSSDREIQQRQIQTDRWLEGVDEFGTMLYAVTSLVDLTDDIHQEQSSNPPLHHSTALYTSPDQCHHPATSPPQRIFLSHCTDLIEQSSAPTVSGGDRQRLSQLSVENSPGYCSTIFNNDSSFHLHDMWNATGPDSNRKAPAGVTPDYNNPEDVYWTLNIVITVLCVFFTSVFFFVRVYVKRTISRNIGIEDLTSLTIQWFYASTVVYIPAAFFTKATILFLMARVFAVEPRVAKGIRIFIWALLVAYIPIQILRIVNCYPIRTYWDPTVRNAHCLNQRKIFFSDLALSIVTDLIILLVPIPLTWRLTLSVGKRIKIVLLLGAGGIATALTLFRVAKAVDFLNSDDITVDYTPISILTALEITIGFVCACLPSLNLLIEHHVRRRRRERNQTWPRDRTQASMLKRHFRWISSSTDPSLPPRPHPVNRPSDGMIDLDVEMAMLTGQPVRLRTERLGSTGSDIRPLDHRLNSGDGRREGWLSQDQDDQDELQDSKFIMRMVEDSRSWFEEDVCKSLVCQINLRAFQTAEMLLIGH